MVVGSVTFIAALITISFALDQCVINLWGPQSEGAGNARQATSSAEPTLQAVTAEFVATPTPTPKPPLDKQLEQALSISNHGQRGIALFEVAKHAVLLADYWTAIRAASATPNTSTQAENLKFVTRCAIEDRLYDLAAEAANEIKHSTTRDQWKLRVVQARGTATPEPQTPLPSRANRGSMACMARYSN